MNFKFRYLVYPVQQDCKLTIEAIYPVTISEEQEYYIYIQPFSGWKRYGLRNHKYTPNLEEINYFENRHKLKVESGVLTISLKLPQEDCYLCYFYIGEQQVQKMEIYALEEDLFKRTPYKGDNHLHSYMSDGLNSPMYMAAAACQVGYDYCVITDHWHFEPSVITKEFYENTGVDFLVIQGEEVHSPDNPVHILNLGGNASVNAWWQKDESEYRNAVAKELETIKAPLLDKDKYTVAACQVVFDKIREVDGIAVLCHPHWILAEGFNETEDVTDYLFDHKRFDVLELIAGGAFEVGTQMQISYYKDRDSMPILGNSDAHGTFGIKNPLGNYTIVFAEKYTADSIKDAIRKGFTIAGNENKLYGDYRLLKFGYFLQRNFYEEHKAERFQLGRSMIRMASSLLNEDPDRVKAVQTPRPSELYDKIHYASEM